MLVNDLEKFIEMIFGEYVELGGMEGFEVIMWLVMCGVLLVNVIEIWCDYYLFLMIGIVMLIFENNVCLFFVDILMCYC